MKINRTVLCVALLASVLALTAFANELVQSDGVRSDSGKDGLHTSSGLTPEEEEHLVYMREEEKLARDVYITMYSIWETPIFSNIADSEQRHMDSLKRMIDKYDVTDPVVNNDVGAFTNPPFTALFNRLVSFGSKSETNAFKVGVLIERLDIKDLEDAIAATTKNDLLNVYQNLMAASYNHLDAFMNQLGY